MQPCVHRSGDLHFVLAVDAAQVVTAAVHNKSRAVFTVCFFLLTLLLQQRPPYSLGLSATSQQTSHQQPAAVP
jgi:hypothetical protein